MAAGFLWLGMLLLVLTGVADAQGRWDYQAVTAAEFETYNPQVAIDRWGNTHLMYSTRDPRRSGLQLFYTSNASGRFAAPVQVTDTGTVFDSSNAALSSFVFRLDSSGVVHVAFVANVENHLRLYYTNNEKGHFEFARFLAERTRYGMAVDSIGQAHVVWAVEATDGVGLRYWSSISPDVDYDAGLVPCRSYRYGCRIGDVEVEAGPRGVIAAVAADSGSIHIFPITMPGSRQRASIPGYDQYKTSLGQADLRFRMALDAEGAIHLLVPRVRWNGQHHLLYASNTASYFTTTLLVDSLPVSQSDFSFDLDFNGRDRIAAVWSATPATALGPGRLGIAEIVKTGRGWIVQASIDNIEPQLVQGRGIWKRGMRVATRGEHVVVSSLARPDDEREEIVAIIERTGLRPQIAYLHPDAAAAEMSVVVETVAPYREKGSFGSDGFFGDAVGLRLVNPWDSARVVVGPSVVSWDGRLLSTMLFIRKGAAPGPVPLQVRIGSGPAERRSAIDTFFIVAPQHIGELSGGGVLGSGGRYGTRSRRGVLVIDSLHLRAGTYRIDTTDTDPALAGNQGFLPITILARGPVRIDSGAVLTVAAEHNASIGQFSAAGPGGGGGGSGGWRVAGGTGFTGGAGPSRYGEGPIGASGGSGRLTLSSRWGGGNSLNGAPGGLIFHEAAGGGGTGHPFGASGTYGRASEREPSSLDSGGYGGATAGSQALLFNGPTTGGGGGGHSMQGSSGNNRNDAINGGSAVGSRPLVPLAGGSGGGGGGFSTNGIASGGGGGGALALYGFSDVVIAGAIIADGAAGIGDIPMTNSSGGGGGAGGGIIIGAKGALRVERSGMVSARGGAGGAGHPVGGRDGGRGSDGRIRIDGRAVGSVATRTLPRASYSGPSSGTNGSIVARIGDTLVGSGEPGRTIRLYMRGENGRWNYLAPIDIEVRDDSTWRLQLGPDAAVGRLYVAVMQRVDNPVMGGFTAEPTWVMSPAGGNILGQPAMSLSRRSHRFDCIKYTSRDTTTIEITNTGTLSDLEIMDVRIEGPGSIAFDRSVRGMIIPPGVTMPLRLYFQPRDTGIFKATVSIVTNVVPDGTATVTLEACAIAGELVADVSEVDLGALCIGDTVTRRVPLRNIGDATVIVERIRGDEGVLEAIALDRPDGFAIPAGGTDTVTIRFTVLDLYGELRLRIESDGNTKNLDIPVRVRDAQPKPELDRTSLTFRTLDISTDDTCDRQTIWLRNRSALDELLIASARLLPARSFTVATPLVGRRIAPGDSLAVDIIFCTANAGNHGSMLEIVFGRGACEAEASLAISGRATIGAADLQMINPPDSAIELRQTLVGSISPRDSVVIVNFGNVAARLAAPRIVPLGTTAADEFAVVEPATLDVAPGDTAVYYVTFAPQASGLRSVDLMVGSDDGAWTARVRVMGTGIQPGIGLNLGELRFGDVRVGSRRALTLEIFNSGSAADVIRSISPSIAAPFIPVFDRALPFTIQPGDTVRVSISYEPTLERRDTLLVSVFAASQPEPLALSLTGRGVLEHAVAIDDSVSFGPSARNSIYDKPEAFLIRNTGTWPLTLTGYDFIQADSLFSWLGAPPVFPLSIDPGEDVPFALRYVAANSETAELVVTTSAPESALRIRLIGSLDREPDSVEVRAESGVGYVGDHVLVGVTADFGTLTKADMRYTVTMSFDAGLLALRNAVAGQPVAGSALAGTMTSGATWDSIAPGFVRIAGTARGGSRSGRLVNIPMLVLAGPPARTDLTIERATFVVTPALLVRTGSGTFVGIDCDTGRGFVSKGRYQLMQNTPNPTAPYTTIEYSVAAREHVLINLYDPSGTLVRSLVDEVKEPGRYRLELDATTIGSGIFTYEMISGPFRDVKRMVVVE